MNSFFLNRLLPTLLFVIALSESVLAQGPVTGGPGPGIPADPTAIPIDGGISLLLAGGVAYGIKHLKSRRKKAQPSLASSRKKRRQSALEAVFFS